MDEPTGTQVPSMFLNFLGSSIDWGYRTEPESAACLGENERRCNWPRGKVIPQTFLNLKKGKQTHSVFRSPTTIVQRPNYRKPHPQLTVYFVVAHA